MKIILAVTLSLFLLGCAHHEVIPGDKIVEIDPKLLQLCDLLDENVKVNSFSDAIAEYGALSTKYGACANKQAAGVKLLKQFGNTK